jgi:hypothetical protein
MLVVPVSLALGCLGAGAATTAVLLVVAEASFIHALIVAVTSAFITGIFLLIATWMNRKTLAKIEDVRIVVEDQAAKAEVSRAEAAEQRAALLKAEEWHAESD